MPVRMTKPSEHSEQVALFQRCLYAGHPYSLIYAQPNGGKRDAVTGARLKAEGARAGVPDLFLPHPAHGYHGLYIELKIQGGRLSAAQEHWLGVLCGEGYAVAVCYGQDEAWAAIQRYISGAF